MLSLAARAGRVLHPLTRHLSASPIHRGQPLTVRSQTPADTDPRPAVTRSVFVSQSHCVFTNLALEQWLFERQQQQQQTVPDRAHFVLLLWRNAPCVVFGRHQNPWQEVDGRLLTAGGGGGVKVARRASGGGCVYHDLGNLNLTFVGDRRLYDRAANLRLLADTINQRWPRAHVSVNDRHDLLVDGQYKISGSAAKLTRNVAYHHCTLLIDGDLTALRSALPEQPSDLESSATASIRSSVTNLTSVDPDITVDRVMTAVAAQFVDDIRDYNGGVHLISPTDDWFPGLDRMKCELSDDQWVYGKCPPFSHTFHLPSCHQIRARVHVKQARVAHVQLLSPDSVDDVSGDEWVKTVVPSSTPDQLETLLDQPYSGDIVQRVECAVLGACTSAPHQRQNKTDAVTLAV